jgi:hypothetical protein
MGLVRKSIAAALSAAMLASSVSGVLAAENPKRHPRRHYASEACPTHRAVDGTLVDCQGWRKRDSVGWDNSCFNLDYLPSQYACSGRRR